VLTFLHILLVFAIVFFLIHIIQGRSIGNAYQRAPSLHLCKRGFEAVSGRCRSLPQSIT